MTVGLAPVCRGRSEQEKCASSLLPGHAVNVIFKHDNCILWINMVTAILNGYSFFTGHIYMKGMNGCQLVAPGQTQ